MAAVWTNVGDVREDACWHLLIDKARTAAPAWVIATVAMALPALTNMARRLRVGFDHAAEDIDSELLAGFLTALRSADLSGPAPYARMCWAGWRTALDARAPRGLAELSDEMFDPAAGCRPAPTGTPTSSSVGLLRPA